MSTVDGPLLVFGPRSTTYDFGPHHPLTPRRFGPGIDLLEAVGARPGLAPEPASDADLHRVHSARYVAAIRRFSDEPWLRGEFGVGLSDNPAFPGMHEAGAAVAGGSLAAIRGILAGEIGHAHHPGGGLHHAMPERCWGFCIYDDPAIAISAARSAGLRVLYVDLDVHHGDGVQAVFYRDPGVLTVSFHESGRYLFPETGFPDELGEGDAAGSAVNVPFEPFSGDDAWLPAVLDLVPALAAAFAPDVIVSQHGADAHAWDPLAHLRVTTRAQWDAARMVDGVAHRWAGGRWLATGGGGYDVYRVVPRVWALTWLAGAHLEPPADLPGAWRDRWRDEAERLGEGALPESFLDEPNAGLPRSAAQAESEAASGRTVRVVRQVVLPALVREAIDRGWWTPNVGWPPDARDASRGLGTGADDGPAPVPGVGRPAILEHVDRPRLARLTLVPRLVAALDADDLRAILDGAADEPGSVLSLAVDGTLVIGVALTVVDADDPSRRRLIALGVAPGHRGAGLGTALLQRHVAAMRPGDAPVDALVTVAERDWVEPRDRAAGTATARRLLEAAGFTLRPVPGAVAAIDPGAVAATRDG